MKEVGAYVTHAYSEAYIEIRSVYVIQPLLCSDEAKFTVIELIYKEERLNVQGYNNVTVETPAQGLILTNLLLPLY